MMTTGRCVIVAVRSFAVLKTMHGIADDERIYPFGEVKT